MSEYGQEFEHGDMHIALNVGEAECGRPLTAEFSREEVIGSPNLGSALMCYACFGVSGAVGIMLESV